MPQLEPGKRAPAFTLTDQRGKKVKLADLKGKQVVVYFYPKADTPGCTTQSCSLRDAMPDLKKLKAIVIGISPDSPERQKKFDEKYELGFTLLADEDHKVADAWGVWGEKSMYGKKYMGIVRSAFVVDETGQDRGRVLQGEPQGHRPEGQRGPQGLKDCCLASAQRQRSPRSGRGFHCSVCPAQHTWRRCHLPCLSSSATADALQRTGRRRPVVVGHTVESDNFAI